MTVDKAEEKPVSQILEEVKDEVCSRLCRYLETTDDDGVCDYIREHIECPLERL